MVWRDAAVFGGGGAVSGMGVWDLCSDFGAGGDFKIEGVV